MDLSRRTSRNSCKLLGQAYEGPSLDTLPLPLDTLSLVTLQNTNCSRSPSTVDVLMLFLSMRGSDTFHCSYFGNKN
jgi:hypothetical protein